MHNPSVAGSLMALVFLPLPFPLQEAADYMSKLEMDYEHTAKKQPQEQVADPH